MKKYKEFHIRTNYNKNLVKAACKHFDKLGMTRVFSRNKYTGISFINSYSDGDYQKCVESGIACGNEMTLDEFFRLTKEDVVIEPEDTISTKQLPVDLYAPNNIVFCIS